MTPSFTNRRDLTFPAAVDKALTWMIAGLVSWLCYTTMTLNERMGVVIQAQSFTKDSVDAIRKQQEELVVADRNASDRLGSIEIAQAEHGWKVSK
jgi:hypothetical protein